MAVPLDTLLLAAIAVGVWCIWREVRGGGSSGDDDDGSARDKIGTQVNIGGEPWSGAHDSHESDGEYEYEDRPKIGF